MNSAYVRMRGDEWWLHPHTAARLEQQGVIWRDHDCDQNTIDNGYTDAGPCYGVSGAPESDEELRNAALLDKWGGRYAELSKFDWPGGDFGW